MAKEMIAMLLAGDRVPYYMLLPTSLQNLQFLLVVHPTGFTFHFQTV